MLIYFVILSAVILRFVPHMPNLAPITALAIFSGAYLPKKQAVGITLAARFISDIFLGFFSWPLMIAVYAAHLVGVWFGSWVRLNADQGPALQGQMLNRWIKIIGSSLGASVLFFLVTNFAFFYSTYKHSLSGVMLAYSNGLPFFRGTLLGDLAYTAALFGGYELVKFLAAYKIKKKYLISNI